MTDRPIIFSGPMVRELWAGRKTRTRRVLSRRWPVLGETWGKKAPWEGLRFDEASARTSSPISGASDPHLAVPFCHPADEPTPTNECAIYRVRPPFELGDRLWVRETWQSASSDNGPCWLYRAGDHRIYPPFDGPDHGAGPSFNYEKYPHDYCHWAADVENRGPWISPIHMPRWASRLTLAVTGIRVQRLQDISEADAIAEGCRGCLGPNPDFPDEWDPTPVEEFRDLWKRLHGPDAWASNPWVVELTIRAYRANIDAQAPWEAAA